MANPFVNDVAVNGTKLAVGAPGRLVLPDTKGAPAVIEAEVTVPAEMKTKLLIARIGHAPRLDQQQFDLVFGVRLMFDAFRDDEHFAR